MAKLLWQPSEERIKSSNMYRFMGFINEKYNKVKSGGNEKNE